MPSLKVRVNLLSDQDPETSSDVIEKLAKGVDPHSVVSDKIRDDKGRVIEVRLCLPDSAAEAARAAIAANKGVATVGCVVPDQLLMSDLTGITYDGTLEADQQFVVMTPPPTSAMLGLYTEAGGYEDGDELISAAGVAFVVANRSLSADLVVLAAAALAVGFNGLSPVALDRSATITVPAATPAHSTNDSYWLCKSGKLYLAFRANADGSTEGPYSFEEAVAAGPV